MESPIFIDEYFLQYVWKFLLFDKKALQTTEGESVEIIQQGIQNFISGPDFQQAKIRIGETTWVGNVEIHLTVKDWKNHGHENDAAYDNLILHVVYEDNPKMIKTKSGREVATVSLRGRIFNRVLLKYERLYLEQKSFIPCENLSKNIDDIFCHNFYERLLISRLQNKIEVINEDIAFCKGNLDEAFILSLFRYFGAPSNKTSFEILGRSIPLKSIIKQAHDVHKIEAILFGQGHLLEGNDDYVLSLRKEYEYYKRLYKMENDIVPNWIFGGVRPPSFPTVKIAQLSALISKEQRWFSMIIEEEDLSLIRHHFFVTPSTYWKNHYHFNKEGKEQEKKISSSFVDKIIINVVIPYLFFYAQYIGDEKYQERALDWISKIAPEQNSIVRRFANIHFPVESARDTQALLQLKKEFCDKKRCLDCQIGYQLLSST